MDVQVTKKFGVIDVTCFCESDVSIIIKKPNGERSIYLPDRITETSNAYTSYSPYTVYGAYSAYSVYGNSAQNLKVMKNGKAQFISFKPGLCGVYEAEVYSRDEHQIISVEV